MPSSCCRRHGLLRGGSPHGDHAVSRPEAARFGAMPGRLRGWAGRVLGALVVAVVGVILGLQYVSPNKRVLSTLAAIVVAGIAWRLAFASGVAMLVLVLPYPKGTTFGSTNLAFVVLLGIIYLLRVSQRELPPARRTPIDAPVLALIGAYVISFYNVVQFGPARENALQFVATVILFYLVVNAIRTERDLQRLHMVQAVATLSILMLALYEAGHPGASIVPGWIDLGASEKAEAFSRSNVRIGSIFMDYELLADFCGLNLLFFAFQFARARGPYARVFHGGMLGLSLFVLFMTVTRGPIVSISVALAYLLWLTRRHVRVVPLTIGAAAIVTAVVGMNWYVSHFTSSGDLFGRFGHTELHGLMPDSRAETWTEAWQRWMMHPFIGWGPYYSHEHGLVQWFWPHNLYLYVANITGILGLSAFLWLLFRLWKLTRPPVDSFTAPRYVDSYLLLARVQLTFFLVDQVKIEYLRNLVYQYQVWLLFAFWVSASMLARRESPAAPREPLAAA
jgi:O-antigen ligase